MQKFIQATQGPAFDEGSGPADPCKKGLPFQHVIFVHAQKRFPLSAKALL